MLQFRPDRSLTYDKKKARHTITYCKRFFFLQENNQLYGRTRILIICSSTMVSSSGPVLVVITQFYIISGLGKLALDILNSVT